MTIATGRWMKACAFPMREPMLPLARIQAQCLTPVLLLMDPPMPEDCFKIAEYPRMPLLPTVALPQSFRVPLLLAIVVAVLFNAGLEIRVLCFFLSD